MMMTNWILSALMMALSPSPAASELQGDDVGVATTKTGITGLTTESRYLAAAECTLVFTCEAHGPMGTFSGDGCDTETRNQMAQIASQICADSVE